MSGFQDLSAEEVQRWFELLGPDFGTYAGLLDGSTGQQLYGMRADLANIITNKSHLQKVLYEMDDENQELARRAMGYPEEPRKSMVGVTEAEMMFKIYQKRMHDVLAAHNPVKLATIDPLLKQFPGKEHQVYVQICKKCNVVPMDPPIGPAEIQQAYVAAMGPAQPAPTLDPALQKWLVAEGFAKYIESFKAARMTLEQLYQITNRGRLIELGLNPKHADEVLKLIQERAEGGGAYARQPSVTGVDGGSPRADGAFRIGEVVQTLCDDPAGGDARWLDATVVNSENNLYNLVILNAAQHGVSPQLFNISAGRLRSKTSPMWGGANPATAPSGSPRGGFVVGENCFTKVISRKGAERWLNARVTHVNGDDTYDIFVYNAVAHGVAPEAVNVQRKFLKKASENVAVEEPPKKRAEGRPQFDAGARVRVHGLRSHTSYNGLCGTVLLYVPSERRYQVRLDTNDVIAIKQRNVAAEEENKPADDELSKILAKMLAENPTMDPSELGMIAAEYLKNQKSGSGSG